MIPLTGQGKPLPQDCPYKGEWLLENVLFLFRPDNQTSLGSPEMTAGFRRDDGEWCFGINSMQLAWALRIGSEQIFEANRIGKLVLAKVEAGATTAGSAKRYTFCVGDRETSLVIEAGPTGTG